MMTLLLALLVAAGSPEGGDDGVLVAVEGGSVGVVAGEFRTGETR